MLWGAFSFWRESHPQCSFYKMCSSHLYKKTPTNLKLVQKYTYGWRLHHWNGLYFVGIFINSYKAVSLLAKCNLKQYDGHRGAASFRQTGNLSSEKLALAQWALLAGRRLFFFFCFFWWIHYVPEQNRQTHPHGWRGAPRAGLAVTKPEGAVVPRNGRVELQLMPLFLEGRRIRKDFHWPYSQLVLLLLH